MDNEYTEQGEEYLREFLDAVMEGDMDSAYDLLADGGINENDFASFFNRMRSYFSGTSTYSIKCTGWNININDGVEKRTTTFLVKTDDGKKVQFTLLFVSGYDGIAGLDCVEVEDEATTINKVVLMFANGWLFSVTTLGIGLMIWMIVDCIKRPIRMKRPKLKFLYILLILVCYGFSLTIGKEFGISSKFALAIPYSNLSVGNSFSFVCTFPIGAIIYFFIRKKLPLVSKEETEVKPEENTDTENQSSDSSEQ